MSTRSSVLLLGLAASGLFACGNTIENVTTSSSSTGNGGASTTSTGTESPQTTSVTSSVTSSNGGAGVGGAIAIATGVGGGTVGSGGAGGAANCEQGCAKAQACFNFDVCGMGGVNCNALTPQEQCIADCFNDPQTTCNDAKNCFGQCQNAATTSTGSGSQQACGQCVGQSCQQQAVACAQDQTCQKWLGCVQGCNDKACITACDAMYPAAKDKEDAVYTCSCSNACATECSATCN